MSILLILIPLALVIGLCWLAFFIWTVKSGQYDDMEGAAHRILMEDDDKPLPDKEEPDSKN
jgi:cbb3-type cytochrome oxidase maturation protein